MQPIVKSSLMIGGTILPAVAAVMLYAKYSKIAITKGDVKLLAVFAIAATVGGYLSSKLLNKVETTL